MPLALKHSWAGKRRQRRIASAARTRTRSHTHTAFSAAGAGGAGAGVSRPDRQPRTSYWGKPSCATHSATSSALQVRKGQTGRAPPAPSGSGCGPSATPGPAGPGRGSIGSIPGPPRQRVFPGPRYRGNHHFREVPLLLPSASPSLLPGTPPAPRGSAELNTDWLRCRGGRLRHEHRGATISLRPGSHALARVFPPTPPPLGCFRPPAEPCPCRTRSPPPPAPAPSPRAATPRPGVPQVRPGQGRGQPVFSVGLTGRVSFRGGFARFCRRSRVCGWQRPVPGLSGDGRAVVSPPAAAGVAPVHGEGGQ